MAVSSTAIPKPTNWDDFEKKMLVLAQSELKDRTAQRNGRSGQKQAGIDVFGNRNGDPNLPFGIQCKQKLQNAVTERELRREAKSALSFKPRPPVEFILATTAPRDQAIQAVARTITEEYRRDGIHMHVAVWGWEDIEERVSQHGDALRAFDPSHTPFVEALATSVMASNDQVSQDVQKLTRVVEALAVRTPAPQSATSLQRDPAALDTPLHGRITALTDLIDDGHSALAIKQLEQLRAKYWDTASDSERYRILVAIASAELKNSNYEPAGYLLLQAYEECPAHPRARQNLAKGYLLVGNATRAMELARDLLRQDPTKSDAANTLIQARLRAGIDGHPLADIPEALHETADVIIAHVYFLRAKNDATWKALIERGSALHPDSALIRIAAAEATLESFIDKRRSIMGGGIATDAERGQLGLAARTLIDAAVDAIDKGYALTISMAVNATLAARFIDDIDVAIKILDAALVQHPQEEIVRTQRAILALAKRDLDAVLELVPARVKDAEARSLRAVALLDMGCFDEGAAVIGSMSAEAIPDHVRFGLHAALCRAHIARKEYEQAIQVARRALVPTPNDLALRSLLIHALRWIDRAAAESELDAAIAETDAGSEFIHRLFLAFEAEQLERNDAVVALLDGYVSVARDSEALQLLIGSLMAERLWVRAGAVLESLPAELASSRWYRRAQVALSINTGQPTAARALDDYLISWPNDASMVFARLGAWAKLGNGAKIKESCASIEFEKLFGPPHIRIRIAAIAVRHGYTTAALPYAYRTLMDHWDDHAAHLAYHGVFLLNDNLADALPPTETVGDNTVVLVSGGDGEHRYRFESRTEGAFVNERVAPDSDLGKLLWGRRAGDVIDLPSLPEVSKSVTVRSILPTYVDAFQRSIDQFNQRFPTARGLWKVALDFDAEDPVKEMRAMTRSRAESNQELLDLYKRTPGMPLAFVARALGGDPIEVWQSLPGAGAKFRVCHGNSIERDSALNLLASRERVGCVVDAITLSAIRRLGIVEAVRHVCGPVYAPQSVLDLLGARALEATGNVGKKMGFVSWQNDRLVMQEYPPELLEEFASEAVREREWARQQVQVAAAVPQVDLDREARTVVTAMGDSIADPVIAADGGQKLLLSEDLGLRLWGQHAFKLHASWLQPVMMIARHEGHMSAREYYDACCTLVLSGHTFISLDSNAILHQLKKDGFAVTAKLSQLIDAIGGPRADLNSNVNVASQFLAAALEHIEKPEDGMRLVSKVLESMTDGHFMEQRAIARSILRALPSKWWTTEHVLAWLAGHSLGTSQFQPAFDDYRRLVGGRSQGR